MSSKKDRRFNLLDRRDSIAMAETRLQSIIGDHLLNLRSIWDQVGMDEGQRSDRIDSVITHVDSLFCDMTNEEKEMALKLVETIKEYKEEIYILSKELHWPQAELLQEKRLIEAESELRARAEELRMEKCRRMKIYKQLYDEDLAVCQQMSIAAYSIAPNVVPSERQLNEIRIHIEQNRRDMEFRRNKLKELKSKIVRLMTKLDLTPKSDIEKEIVKESVDTLPLTSEFLHESETLLIGLENRFEMYLDSIRHQVGELKGKLESLWKSCHVDETYRNNFPHVDEEDFDEHALDRYNAEISRWQAYYEERQEILDKIDSWMRLWNEKLQYEEKDKDANRYLNRAGALLQEQKDRKKLEKSFPLIQEDIKKLLQQWNATHPGQPILLDRRPALEYFDHIQKEHHEKKEKEKIEKQLAKKQQLETERMYGTSPSSKRTAMPVRRINTPNSQNRGDFGASKTYVHSSLAMVRSPAMPGARAVVTKPPPGLPRPVPKVAVKRKQNFKVDEHLAPLSQMNHADVSIATTASSSSYKEFAQEIREKGLQGQSSFIVLPTPTPTPTKMMKR